MAQSKKLKFTADEIDEKLELAGTALQEADIEDFVTEEWVGEQGFATEEWVDENALTKGVAGAYTLDSATLDGLTVQQWLDENINNRYFTANVTLNFVTANTTTDILITNVGAAGNVGLSINASAQIARVLSIYECQISIELTANTATLCDRLVARKNSFFRFNGTSTIANTGGESSFGAGSVVTFRAGCNITFGSTNNLATYDGALFQVFGTVNAGNFFSGGTLLVAATGVLNVTSFDIASRGFIIDNRPGRPLETYVRRYPTMLTNPTIAQLLALPDGLHNSTRPEGITVGLSGSGFTITKINQQNNNGTVLVQGTSTGVSGMVFIGNWSTDGVWRGWTQIATQDWTNANTLSLGVTGDYEQGVDFDGTDLPTFQEWLDENVNDKFFNDTINITINEDINSTITIRNTLGLGRIDIFANARLATTLHARSIENAGVWIYGNAPTIATSMILRGKIDLAGNGHFGTVSFQQGGAYRIGRTHASITPDTLSISTLTLESGTHTFILTSDTAITINSLVNSGILIIDQRRTTPLTINTISTAAGGGFVVDGRPGRPLETYTRNTRWVNITGITSYRQFVERFGEGSFTMTTTLADFTDRPTDWEAIGGGVGANIRIRRRMGTNQEPTDDYYIVVQRNTSAATWTGNLSPTSLNWQSLADRAWADGRYQPANITGATSLLTAVIPLVPANGISRGFFATVTQGMTDQPPLWSNVPMVGSVTRLADSLAFVEVRRGAQNDTWRRTFNPTTSAWIADWVGVTGDWQNLTVTRNTASGVGTTGTLNARINRATNQLYVEIWNVDIGATLASAGLLATISNMPTGWAARNLMITGALVGGQFNYGSIDIHPDGRMLIYWAVRPGNNRIFGTATFVIS